MSENKLITVIVPVYNTEDYLRECVDSIIAQTHKNLEIILVDDGSTDSSGGICDEYALKDSRISVYHQKNSGQAGARNHALSVARGDYIGFVDSDDYIAPNMYEVMLRSMERNDADVIVCGRLMVRGEKITVPRRFHADNEAVFGNEEAVKRFLTYKRLDSSPVDKLYKKDLISDIRFPLGYICEDMPFVYEAISKSSKVVHCAHDLYFCRVREGSTSRSSFSERGMGLYYNVKAVYDKCIASYPKMINEADFFKYKNLLVLGYRIASSSKKYKEAGMVNSEIRKNINTIKRNKYLDKKYKFFARVVCMRMQRLAVRVGGLFGFSVG